MRIEDKACNFIDFKGNEGFSQEDSERQIGKGHLSGDAFYGDACRNASELISCACRCGLRKQILETVEGIGHSINAMPQKHRDFPLRIMSGGSLPTIAIHVVTRRNLNLEPVILSPL